MSKYIRNFKKLISKNKRIVYLNEFFEECNNIKNETYWANFCSLFEGNGLQNIVYANPRDNCVTVVLIDSERSVSFLFFLSRYIPIFVSFVAPHKPENLVGDKSVLQSRSDYDRLISASTGYEKIDKNELLFPIELDSSYKIHASLKKKFYLDVIFDDERIFINSIEE